MIAILDNTPTGTALFDAEAAETSRACDCGLVAQEEHQLLTAADQSKVAAQGSIWHGPRHRPRIYTLGQTSSSASYLD